VLHLSDEYPSPIAFVGGYTLVDVEVEDHVGTGSPGICLCSMYQDAIRWHKGQILPSFIPAEHAP
jgi:hypothetical protein